jgi:hypothetical protein
LFLPKFCFAAGAARFAAGERQGSPADMAGGAKFQLDGEWRQVVCGKQPDASTVGRDPGG